MKKLPFFLLLIFLISSCNSVKRVTKEKHLLSKNTIVINKKKDTKTELADFIIQRPNTKTLGLLPLPLYLYNWGDINNPKTPSSWGKKHSKTYRFFKNVFSEKQSISFANSSIGINNWLLRNGQAPVILDLKKTRKTANNFSAYLETQGFFNNTVSFKIDSLNKKAHVTYFITKGEPLIIDSISTQIGSKILNNLYQSKASETLLKKGQQYNDNNFRKEANRIINLYRNSGIYHFNENYIDFEIDTLINNKRASTLLKIDSTRLEEINGKYISKPFKALRVKNITVVTDYAYTKKNNIVKDSATYNNIKFYAFDKIRYNPKYLSQSIFIKLGRVYRDKDQTLTRNHLKSLRNFKSVSIRYHELENDDTGLGVTILLTPIEKFAVSFDTELTHSNVRNIGLSGKFSFLNRNTFKGAEIFKLSFSGSYFRTETDPGWEIGSDASLTVPRFLVPFGLTKLVPKRMSPKSTFSLGINFQRNIGLDRQTINGGLTYKWKYNSKKTIQLDVFNIQYIRNINANQYYNIYRSEYNKLAAIIKSPSLTPENAVDFTDDIIFGNSSVFLTTDQVKTIANIANRRNIITSDFIIPTIAYSFTYNNQENTGDNSFSFFKIRIANSGHFFSIFNTSKNDFNQKTLFKTPLAQYIKTDIEYKKFWSTSKTSTLGLRSFLGIAIPYDNSEIPFPKSYFVGGANDIRAWKSYDLGPGTTAQGLEFNTGNLKFLTSLEYRFNVLGSLKGALFVDAGNIWNLTSEFFDSEATFQGLKSLKDIAVGSGFGARYDLKFLVLRLDLGFKTHEPYLTENKWFQNFSFDKAVYNIGINYPF